MRRDAPVVVLGEFDGFHLGHRALVTAAATLAERRRAPLVGVVLDAGDRERVLSDPATRCHQLLAAGAHHARVVEVPAGTGRASDIVDRICAHREPAAVAMACLVGDRPTPYPHLRNAFERRGVPVVEVERVLADDEQPVSSDRVREAVALGRVEVAAALLGRPHRLDGVVVRGNQLGRTIGFPTANLTPPERLVIPAHGVYAAQVAVDRRGWRAAVNIGTRPTVDDRGITVVEAHLLDFSGDLYDRRIRVELTHRLRDERRFESLDELTAQLAADVATVRTHPMP